MSEDDLIRKVPEGIAQVQQRMAALPKRLEVEPEQLAQVSAMFKPLAAQAAQTLRDLEERYAALKAAGLDGLAEERLAAEMEELILPDLGRLKYALDTWSQQMLILSANLQKVSRFLEERTSTIKSVEDVKNISRQGLALPPSLLAPHLPPTDDDASKNPDDSK